MKDEDARLDEILAGGTLGGPHYDEIFERVRSEGIVYGSGPRALDDMKINHRRGGRGFYFHDPNGHVLEVLTA